MTTNLFLGFDPGGEDALGWSICREVDGILQGCPKTGLADHAGDAVNQVEKEIQNDDSLCNLPILCAGIDAPLLVHKIKGNRNIDRNLRGVLRRKKFPRTKVNGTVQAVNSLQGAATIQGGLLVIRLAKKPWAQDIKITESHPTAFRYLLSHAGQDDLAKTADCLTKDLITCDQAKNHKRDECKQCKQDSHKVDATLCAVAAWAATRTPPLHNWKNLYDQENFLIPLFQITGTPPLSYWMPMPR